MVRAILEGRKTQTRRVFDAKKLSKMSGQTWTHAGIGAFHQAFPESDWPWRARAGEFNVWSPVFACPYGKPGDRLWVRESFRQMQDGIDYKADHEYRIGFTWKPSIHMFRKDSRITLEITNIRVERLREISEDNAKAEGVSIGWYVRDTPDGEERVPTDFVSGFRHAWDKINGKKHPWASNPWIWVIEFKKVNCQSTNDAG